MEGAKALKAQPQTKGHRRGFVRPPACQAESVIGSMIG